MNPLTRDQWNEFIDLEKKANSIRTEFESRAGYIISTIAKLSGRKYDWWDFANGSEDGDIPGSIEISSNQVPITGAGVFFYTDNAALLNDGEWGFEDGFPSRWLFEDFEDELKRGIEDYKEQLVKKKEEQTKKRKEYVTTKKEKDALLKKLSKLPSQDLKKLITQIK